MGTKAKLALTCAAAAALLALALPGAASAGLLGVGEKRPKATVATTGKGSELKRAVPISPKPGQKERVAMSLAPDALPDLAAGDTLRASGEVQVSTTCVRRSKRCIGRRYEFNPFITARIVLASAPDVTAPSMPLSEGRQIKCTQRRPQRNHHCPIAFPNLETTLSDPAAAPCALPDGCYVNLIVGAWHRKAKRGNRVVLGADRPDGSVKQDKGRLNVVHSPAGVAGPGESFTSHVINAALPLNEGKKVKRRVIHSIEVPAAKKGEVIAFDASYVATIDPIPYNTFISNRIVIGETPLAVESKGFARRASQLKGQGTATNGFNCTQGRSGFSTPCTAQKAGAIRFTRDAVDPDTKQPVSVYVNLVAAAKPLLYPMQHVKRWHGVQISPHGGLRVQRWTPE